MARATFTWDSHFGPVPGGALGPYVFGAAGFGDLNHAGSYEVGQRIMLEVTAMNAGATAPVITSPGGALVWTMILGETFAGNHYSIWLSNEIADLTTEGFEIASGATELLGVTILAWENLLTGADVVAGTYDEVNAAGDTTLADFNRGPYSDIVIWGGVGVRDAAWKPYSCVSNVVHEDFAGNPDDNFFDSGFLGGITANPLWADGGPSGLTYELNNQLTPASSDDDESWAFIIALRGEDSIRALVSGGDVAPPAIGGGTIDQNRSLTGGGAVAPPAIGSGTIQQDVTLSGGGDVAPPEVGVGQGWIGQVQPGDPTAYAPGSIAEQEAIRWGQDAAEEAEDPEAIVPYPAGTELEVFVYDPSFEETERRLFQYSDLEVVHPWNDSRTLTFRAPMFDTNAVGQSNVRYFKDAGYYFVKVLYRNRLIFNGPILEPDFDFDAGHVTVSAHDPTIFLKRHHVHSWDVPLLENNGKLPVSGESMWKIVQAAFTDDDGNSFRIPGFRKGHVSQLAALANSYVEVQLGQSLWELLQQMAELADGPDFDFRPVDRLHGPWDGYYPDERGQDTCEFRAFLSVNDDGKFDGVGSDKSDRIVFHYGWGRGNLKNFHYVPNAEALVTRAIASPEKGSRLQGRAQSEVAYGIFETWDQPGSGYMTDAKKRLWIEAQLAAYSEPLQAFSLEPHWDQGLMGSAFATPWRYPTGYTVGDRIRAIAKKGNDFDEVFTVNVAGRVTEVKLTQQNAVENVKATIEIIPEGSADIAVSYGDV